MGEFAGVPAVAIETSSTGTFGIGLTIAPTVSPGDYSVSLRCGGGLAASGTLTVQALPRTGAPVETFAVVGAILLAAGAVLAGFSRHRRADTGSISRYVTRAAKSSSVLSVTPARSPTSRGRRDPG